MKLPSVDQYVSALTEAAKRDNNQPLLRAHYKSPERKATTEELASAVGFLGASGVNAQYGNLASRVCNYLGRTDFEPKVRILVSETSGAWIMHPQVADALERLAWVS